MSIPSRFVILTPSSNNQTPTNCDATTCVLTATTNELLAPHVPESKGTQQFQKAAVWTHEPFTTYSGRSLWAGLITWHRWRQYIQLTPELTITSNSRAIT